MGLGGVVRVGVGDALAGSFRLRSRSNGGEGGGELEERLSVCHSRVAYWKGDEFHMSPVFLEGRDKRGVLRGLASSLVSQPRSRQNPISMNDDEGAEALVEGGRVRGGGVGYPSGVYKVRRCSMSGGVELLNFYVW